MAFTGWSSVINGDPDQAVESFETVLRLNPADYFNVFAWSGLSWAHWSRDEYEEGFLLARKAETVFPQIQSLGAYIANAVPTKRLDQAREAFAELTKNAPGFTIAQAIKRLFSALPKNEKLWNTLFEQSAHLSRSGDDCTRQMQPLKSH